MQGRRHRNCAAPEPWRMESRFSGPPNGGGGLGRVLPGRTTPGRGPIANWKEPKSRGEIAWRTSTTQRQSLIHLFWSLHSVSNLHCLLLLIVVLRVPDLSLSRGSLVISSYKY